MIPAMNTAMAVALLTLSLYLVPVAVRAVRERPLSDALFPVGVLALVYGLAINRMFWALEQYRVGRGGGLLLALDRPEYGVPTAAMLLALGGILLMLRHATFPRWGGLLAELGRRAGRRHRLARSLGWTAAGVLVDGGGPGGRPCQHPASR